MVTQSTPKHSLLTSSQILNPLVPMQEARGKTLDRWGRDQTGLVTYQFNQQGFRSLVDFDWCPKQAFFGCSITFGIGVPFEQTFAGKFSQSHNYGICGIYTNQDIANVLQQFLDATFYTPATQIAVVWSDRDQSHLGTILDRFSGYDIHHFFCGPFDQGKQRYRFPPQLDKDVSGTHPGPRTHEFMYKSLCALFER